MTDEIDTTSDIISLEGTDGVIEGIRLAVEAKAISHLRGSLMARYVRTLSARLAEAERERDEALARVAAVVEEAARLALTASSNNDAEFRILDLADDAEHDALAEVRRQERERCARVADDHAEGWDALRKAALKTSCANDARRYLASQRATRDIAIAIRNMKDETDE